MLTYARYLFVVFTCFANSVAAAPKIEAWTSPSGARVNFVSAMELPMVDIRIVFAAGSSRDGERPGAAHFVNALLAEGAGEFDSNAFSERIAATGAEFDTGALRDMAWVALRSLSDAEYLQPSLTLLAAVLSAPRFDADAIERIRANTLVRLKHDGQSPGTVARRAFFRAVFRDHPYASPVPGTVDAVAALDGAAIRAFHQRYYVQQNAIISIVGALTRAQAEEIATALSKDMPSGSAAERLPAVTGLADRIEQHIEFPSIQSHVYIGQPGMKRGDPDYFALLVGNHVLGGGGLVSILFDEVREKRGLSYSVNSYFSPMTELGPFIASLQTDNSQQAEAIAVMREEIEKFVLAGPDPAALDAAKQNLIGGFPLRIDSNKKIVEYLSMIGFYDLPLDYLETFPERVAAIDVAAVKDAFTRRLHPDKMVTVVVGKQADGS